MDCEDTRGYTPLFYASKAGEVTNILELIENGANVNHSAESHEVDNYNQGCITNGKTPLFRARNYEAVLLLLKFGADPCLKENETEAGERLNHQTAIEHLMKYNVDCVKAILDNQLCNDPEHNLVLNFHVFKGDDKNEMSLFETARNNERSSLLLHPLMQIFLNLKYKTVWMTFLVQIIFQLFLVVVFTIVGIEYVEFTSCKILQTSHCLQNSSLKPDVCFERRFKLQSGLIGYQINGTHSRIPEGDGDYYPVICHKNSLRLKEDAKFMDSVCLFEECDEFYFIFHNIFLVLLSMFLLKEICEGFSTGIKAYFLRLECLIEGLLLCLSLGFAFTCLDTISIGHMQKGDNGYDEYNYHYFALHLAAWMVFFVWINLILYLGKLQVIGIYIFMALDVFMTMVFVLLTFCPFFAAFTFGFYILLESNEGFESYTRTLVRSIAMMAGEFNFDDYFDFEAVEKSGSRNYSTQVMFVFFVIIISLIVMNLLIALTVSKIDSLKKKGKLLQVKRIIKDVTSLSSMVRYNKNKWLKNLIEFYPINVQMPILERLQKENCSQVCMYLREIGYLTDSKYLVITSIP